MSFAWSYPKTSRGRLWDLPEEQVSSIPSLTSSGVRAMCRIRTSSIIPQKYVCEVWLIPIGFASHKNILCWFSNRTSPIDFANNLSAQIGLRHLAVERRRSMIPFVGFDIRPTNGSCIGTCNVNVSFQLCAFKAHGMPGTFGIANDVFLLPPIVVGKTHASKVTWLRGMRLLLFLTQT